MTSLAQTRIDEVRKKDQRLAARPKIPFEVYKRQQAQISRRRLYPVTVFYTAYALGVLVLAFQSAHPVAAAAFFLAGVSLWTLIEYLFHRYVLHGTFREGEGVVRQFLHRRLDPLHWEHHARPLDGMHINGAIGDLIVLFFISAPLSFIAPVYSLPVLLAGCVQSYVLEEWVHHSAHFYRFRNPYFRYIRRHHGYHHTPAGTDLGYGLSSGLWDVVFNTRYPESVRRVLYCSSRPLSAVRPKQMPIYELDQQIVWRLLSAANSRTLSKTDVIDLALSEPQLAATAAAHGSPREVVSETLTRFQRYGLIEIKGGRLTALDEDFMRAYAG